MKAAAAAPPKRRPASLLAREALPVPVAEASTFEAVAVLEEVTEPAVAALVEAADACDCFPVAVAPEPVLLAV